jgi:SWI/SNF-related matrix-associated actin-dependent regulator 1 of chromatin subfamily A
MNLTHRNNRYEFEGGFETRQIPKDARFRWDSKGKVWWTTDPDRALQLRNIADAETVKRLDVEITERSERVEHSKAVASNQNFPIPDGLEYLPYQKAGIAFGVEHENLLLADEMGLGKTIQTLGIINALELKTILVVCPASLKMIWKREAVKWLVGWTEDDIRILQSTSAFPVDGEKRLIIINYDITGKFREALRYEEWDLLVCDEAHYMKNQKARRTKEVLGFTGKKVKHPIEPIPAARMAFLTGTPIMNRPVELWSLASALAPGDFSNYWSYVHSYCGAHKGPFGWDVSGASNLDELQHKLRASVMIRRLKKDVLLDLPPKLRQVIELPPAGLEREINAENDAWKVHAEAERKLKEIVSKAAKHENRTTYNDSIAELRKGVQARFAEMAAMRQETALKKVPLVTAHVREILEAVDKVVIMAHHHAVVDAIVSDLNGVSEYNEPCVSLTGRLGAEERQYSVDRFQNDPTCKVFVGGIQAAGVGITLTASSTVVFAELDWVPANLSQAEDRCHRIGQHSSVLVQHLVLEGSLDATMAKRLVSKQTNIDNALDVEHSMIPQQIVPSIEDRSLAVLTGVPDPLARLIDKTSPAYEKKPQADISADDICDIHEAIKYVSALCDGARALDGMGFNRFDADFGHQLAHRASLTPNQAVAGRELVRKYRKQLPESLKETL